MQGRSLHSFATRRARVARLRDEMRDDARWWFAACVVVGLVFGCSSKAPNNGMMPTGAAGSALVTAGGSGGLGGSGASTLGGSTATAGSSPDLIAPPDSGVTSELDAAPGDVCGSTCPSGLTCAPETCDGVDNNCDGIIDNVDKDSDGVCDCLLIATLGSPGPWGDGDVFATWLSARSNVGAVDLGDQTLTADLLAKYEVIVAQDLSKNHLYSSDEVAALQAWVQGGGGFMTLLGYADPGEGANVNQLLAPFSVSYGTKQILPAVNNATFPITDWTPHPIDQGVMAVGIDNGYEVRGQGTVIARGGGYDVGIAKEVLPGHIFAWADEWITYDSEWQQHADYQVELFWLNAIKWLTAANKCQVAIPPPVVK